MSPQDFVQWVGKDQVGLWNPGRLEILEWLIQEETLPFGCETLGQNAGGKHVLCLSTVVRGHGQ